jgi:hypothetical protein
MVVPRAVRVRPRRQRNGRSRLSLPPRKPSKSRLPGRPPRARAPREDSGNAGCSLVQRSAIPRASAVLEATAPTKPCLALPGAIQFVYKCTVLGAVAELERSLILERVRAGLGNARANGKRLGRPEVALDAERIGQLRAQGRSTRQIAEQLGHSRSLVHKTLANGESRRVANAADQERAQSCPGNTILRDPARTRHRLESHRQTVNLPAEEKSPGLNALL